MNAIWDNFWLMMERGSFIMWPLLILSVLGLTLILERFWFWLMTNGPGRTALYQIMMDCLRRGDTQSALEAARTDRTIYGRTIELLLKDKQRIDDALTAEVVQLQRPKLERFMPTLSTIITAAPLLGILGTVTGLIASFEIISQKTSISDPRAVSPAIAEALITTAAGLSVAIIVLFPYNAFRAQIDRTLGRLETLITAAEKCNGDGAATETLKLTSTENHTAP